MKNSKKLPTITVGVPAYSRPDELHELIESVISSTELPDELLIVEDKSPEREKIRSIITKYQHLLKNLGCSIKYIENPNNLGYDGNLRKVIAESSSDYVLLLGNDDALFPNAIATVKSYLSNNSETNFISRTYSRFTESTSNVINTTWISKTVKVFSSNNCKPSLIFRLCGFVGGLVVKCSWANSHATDRYDGTLYYQYYLACLAYLDQGIGYISESIVAGRAGNPPLFGVASSESQVHIPGSYTPQGRAKMWAGILRITIDIDAKYRTNLLSMVRQELSSRQSFHIYEMMPVQGRCATIQLFKELRALGLTSSWVPWFLTSYILIFGRSARYGFAAFRSFQFFVEKNIKLKL